MTTPDFSLLEAVRCRRPLVHCISNLVSANDCANLALAVGASPVMAQAPEEMEALAAASAAAVLNTGTPDEEKFRSCLLRGQAAQRLGQPVILDPVGVGGSPWRLGRVEALLSAFTPSLLRVNPGEAQALLHLESQERGVDSPAAPDPDRRAELALRLARERGTAVLLTGPEDLASDGEALWKISGGSPLTAQITGTGCMLSVLCGVFAAVEPDALRAAVAAAAFWRACARRAEERAGNRGPGSFRAALLDAAGTLTAPDLAAGAGFTKGVVPPSALSTERPKWP